MITAQNGKGSRARKVDGDKYRASKLWDKKGEQAPAQLPPPPTGVKVIRGTSIDRVVYRFNTCSA